MRAIAMVMPAPDGHFQASFLAWPLKFTLTSFRPIHKPIWHKLIHLIFNVVDKKCKTKLSSS